MKLAIYGDSFADYRYHQASTSLSAEHAWSRRLELDYQVKNFSLTASGLFWSMCQFEKSYDWADKVVFIVSGRGRYPGYWAYNDQNYCISSADQAIKHLADPRYHSHPDYSQLKRQVEAVRDWYMWARFDEFENYVHELQITRIRSLRPDAILIPIMPQGSLADSICTTEYIIRGFRSWQSKEERPWNVIDDYRHLYPRYPEKMTRCHFTLEENQLFYQHIQEALTTGSWNPSVPEQIAHANPIDYYYSTE